MPYPQPPGFEFADVIRVSMPNRWLDPDTTNQVYHKYFDLIQAADDLGLDVMFNEHHQTLSNLVPGMPLIMAIAARQTKRCRLLALGNPVANRPDPVRVAVEMAMIDTISHGRLDCGFVRGAFFELPSTNARPTDMFPRMLEAIDLIVKAWTSHDGPFNWEGEFFHHREVSIIPRPYQQPHPPIWISTSSASSAIPIAERGYVAGSIFVGTERCMQIFKAYRETYEKTFGFQPHPDRLAYSSYIFVGDTDEEALQEALKVQDFSRQSSRHPRGTMDMPAFYDPRTRATMLKADVDKPGSVFSAGKQRALTVPEQLVRTGSGFYGNPDSVFEQLKAIFHTVGGFGHFMGMFQASNMSYALTTKSMRLFAEKVLPRFREEVYEPWLKERGLKQRLLTTGFAAAT
jgi:alkanesulfonate monooxygenase SsuD/methylene tetrahydromethanopterin reductase-like flavin-dependent oxidoreductase (luciferase family)